MANEKNKQISSNLKIDIDALYQSLIKEIDNTRSYVGINDAPGIISALNGNTIKNITEVKKQAFNISTEKQESRCHAFYRMIGLPVVVDDVNYYSPGFDYEFNKEGEAAFNSRASVIKSIPSDLLKASIHRENYFNQIVSNFFKNQSIASSLVALSSYNIRKFITSSFEGDNNPLDSVISSQSYKVDDKDANGNRLSEYDNIGDNTDLYIDFTSALNREHLIKPITVNPLIELTVQPESSRLCAPFVSESATKLNDTTILKRPLIEKICRERFYVKNNITTSQEIVSEAISSLGEDPKSSEVLQKLKSLTGNESTKQSNTYNKYIDILNSLTLKLIKSQRIIEATLKDYHWIPIPNVNGPEFGSETKAINYSKINYNNTSDSKVDNLYTEKDKAIATGVRLLTVNQLMFNLTGERESIPSEQFNFSSFNVSSDESSGGFGDKNEQMLKRLISLRNDQCKKANNALREIEIITGEFSGLGLIDIICIYASLYFIPETNLVGLLDKRAYDRMKKIKGIGSSAPAQAGVIDSLKVFANMLKQWYDLAQSLYDTNKAKQ